MIVLKIHRANPAPALPTNKNAPQDCKAFGMKNLKRGGRVYRLWLGSTSTHDFFDLFFEEGDIHQGSMPEKFRQNGCITMH